MALQIPQMAASLRVAPDSVARSPSFDAALARLIVVHVAEPRADGPGLRTESFGGGAQALRIRTCQREVSLSVSAAAPQGPGEIHAGAAAYRFLLEFASGLESAIPGETNVFGQVREAWRALGDSQPDCARELEPLIEAWFRDVRFVRTRFLQGIGGQSYATLARRLLAPGNDARVLIVGFGELGRTMPPRFGRHGIAVFERTSSLPTRSALRRFGPGEERTAAEWATHIVMCVPSNADTDARWVAALRGRDDQRIVHLGARRGETGAWVGLRAFFDLDDVFDLQREQSARRARQLRAARAACAELARPERAVCGVLL